MPLTYEIRIRGRLSSAQLAALAGKEVDFSDAITTLMVDVPDGDALHSVLTRIEDFALDLISVVETRRGSRR